MTAQSQAFAAPLSPNASMTVTVTFAPGAAGTFNNVDLPIGRVPANGDANIICNGQAQVAQAAFTVFSNGG